MLNKYASDKLQIVWLKEIRQTIRSKALLLFIAITLLMEGVFTYGYIIDMVQDNRGDDTALFYCITIGIITCIFMALISARSNSERFEEGLDPMLCTQLTPLQVAWGKTLAMWTLGAIVVVVASPLMFFISFDQKSTLLLMLLLLALAIAQSTLWGSSIRRIGSKISFNIFALSVPVFIFIFSMFFCPGYEDISETYLIYYTYVLLGFVVLFFTLLVTTLRKPSYDKARPVRLVVFLLSLPFIPIFRAYIKEPDFDWTMERIPCDLFLIAATIIFITSSCERLLPTPRMVHDRCKNWVLRVISYPFTSGANSGILFGIIICLIGYIACSTLTMKYNINKFDTPEILLANYALFYASLVIFLRSQWNFSVKKAWVIVLLACYVPTSLFIFQGINEALILTPFYADTRDPLGIVFTVLFIVSILLNIAPAISFIKAYNAQDDKTNV